MFTNTLRLHVTHNRGNVNVRLARHNTVWDVTLNGVTKSFTVGAISSMTEEKFLEILRDEFGVNIDNLPRLEQSGARKSPPPLTFYGVRKRGRPRKNTSSTSSKRSVTTSKVVDIQDPNFSAVDDLVADLT